MQHTPPLPRPPRTWLPLALALALLAAPAPAVAADSKEELQKKAETLHEELAARLRSHGSADREVQDIRWRLGSTLQALGLPKKALEYYRPAEAEITKRSSPTDSSLVGLRCTIATTWQAAGKREEGLEFLKVKVKSLPAPEERKDPELRLELAGAMNDYGAAFHGLHAYEDALAMFEGGRAIYRELRGEDHMDTIYATNGSCACWIELGRFGEARDPLERMLATLLEHHADQTDFLQTVRNNLAYLYKATGEHGKALGIFDFILEELDKAGAPPDDATRLLAAENRAGTLASLGRHAEAVAAAEVLIATLEKLVPKSQWKEDIESLEKSRKEWRKIIAEGEKGKRGAADPPAKPPEEPAPGGKAP